MYGSKLFSKPDFAQNWNSKEFLSYARFGALLVGPVRLFVLHHFILSINGEVLVSLTGKLYFVVCDASLHQLIKISDRV